MPNKNLSLSRILNSSSTLSNNHSSLEHLKTDIKRNLQIFSNNVKNLKKKMTYLESIFNDLEDQENNTEIAKVFKETIESAIDELDKYLNEQEKAKEEFYLLEARFIEHIIQIILAVIEFQRKLDKLYPDLSKKIIDYLGNFLVALLATQMPIVALAIKSSSILDTLKSYISTEGLTNALNNWKDALTKTQTKLTEIKEDKVLKKQFSSAEQVAEISEITGISTVAISELGLENKSLKQVKNAISQNPKTIESLKEITELSKSIPNNKDSIIETINKLATEIIKILGDVFGIDENLKENINKELSSTKENLIQASTTNKNIGEKLEYCYKAAKNIFNIYNKIAETIKSTPNNDKIVENIGNLIKDRTKNILPSIFLKSLTSLPPKLKSLSKIIKIENVLKIAFEKNTTKTLEYNKVNLEQNTYKNFLAFP
ncbi:MAG: hypothetical protein RCG15_09205 [Candidatus Rickettsia vulgarisii]